MRSWVLGAVVGFAACAAQVDVKHPTDVKSPDAAADLAYREARAKQELGDQKGAAKSFDEFVTRWPSDPLRPSAELGLGRAELALGNPKRARAHLEIAASSPAPDVARSARYWGAVADAQNGACGPAQDALVPFDGKLEEDSTVTMVGALAECFAKAGQTQPALAYLARVHATGAEHEKLYAWGRAEEVAGKSALDEALKSWEAAPAGLLTRAALGPSIAARLRARGDLEHAQRFAREAADAAPKYAPPPDGSADAGGPSSGGAAVPSVVGCVLELQGPLKAFGERALRGALLAAGATGVVGKTPNATVAVRQAATVADVPGAVGDLLTIERAIAIIGPIDRKAVPLAADQAGTAGAVVLSLAVADDVSGKVLRMIHGPSQRARALASHAAHVHAGPVAVLAPSNAYGRLVAEAFLAVAKAEGLQVIADIRYEAQSTSFTKITKQLRAKGVQTVFVGDTAAKLELIAPALAVVDLWSTPHGEKAGAKRRAILLMSTAEAIGPRLMQNAGRYLQGAVLAPGYYADDGDEKQAEFISRYRQAYGEDPGVFDAHAYDAVRAVRATVERGATTHAQVRQGLMQGTFPGVTGGLRFGEHGERLDAPRLYVVDGERVRTQTN